MKVAVLEANPSGEAFTTLASTWLRWEMSRLDVTETDVSAADVLLASVDSQQSVSDLRRALKRIGNHRAKVVLGGGGAYAPAVFDGLIDVACVGEGSRFVRTLLTQGYDAAAVLPEAWVPGETRTVIPNADFDWDIPPLRCSDGTVRVFASRGCRYRCLFCQTGWEQGYRVHPEPAILQARIAGMEKRGAKVVLVSNDSAEEHVHLSKRQEHMSVRFDNLRKLMPLIRKHAGAVRIGVDGVSERLRLAVGKPVGTDELLGVTRSLMAEGVGVTWFMIVGYPGETDADYDELRALVRGLHGAPKGLVMMKVHSFLPQPATPLGILPIEDMYWERFDEFRRWFFDGPGFTRRLQIVAPYQYRSRLERAQQGMAATEPELRRGWWEHDNPNWRVQYRSTPAELRRVASVYARRLGATA